ncbi:MAG TPA: VOC family protein [Stellaceae bacterium]|nr:VOC family protein [Stellaceae bacterium]
MRHPNFMLLYVDSPKASGTFYADLLGREPVEASPTFVLFALDSGLMFGLWSRHTVEPAATAAGGGAELAFRVADPEIDTTYADWKARGLTILQEPTILDFGRTFVALDPDGHRLRVFAPAEETAAKP